MQERIIKFGPHSSLVGILTEADTRQQKDLCVIISNSGLIHKPGPNRLSVKIARQLAAMGVCTFRFDFSGTGDSPLSGTAGNTLSANIAEIRSAMDKLSPVTGVSRFALYGLCSAAEVSFKASLVDDRVSCLVLVDGYYHAPDVMDAVFPEAIHRCAVRYYRKSLFSRKRSSASASGKTRQETNSPF